MRLNLGCGAHMLDGFVNLDASNGWRFEDGFPSYEKGCVDAVTISHALMYVPIEDWPAVFAELARVTATDGVIRITEDSTGDPASERFGGHHDAVTLTTSALVVEHLETAGFVAAEIEPGRTRYRDRSLIQRWHGDPPKVFFVEGVRQ